MIPSYGVTGSLTVAVSDDEVAPFEQLRTSLLRRGGPGAGGCAEVSPERARALFPPLGRVRGAITVPGAPGSTGVDSPRR